MSKLPFSFCSFSLFVFCVALSPLYSQIDAYASVFGEMRWTNNLLSLDQLHARYNDLTVSARTILLTENIPYTNELNIRYGCGFFCYGLNCDGFLFAIFLAIYGSHDPQLFYLQMVWSANRDSLVHENATLTLTSKGSLLLNDSDGTPVWSSNTFADSFGGMMIQNSGNLVLFSSPNETLWQSFDHPTDTILLGQKWKVGMKLVSNISPTNTSQGIFSVNLFHDGLARLVGLSDPRIYLRSSRKRPNVSIAYVLLDKQWMLFYPEEGPNPIAYLTLEIPNNTLYFKIESDGRIPYYSFGEKTGISAIDYTSGFTNGTTTCDYPTNCGEYGICSDGQCSCPRGANQGDVFSPINDSKPNSGCKPLNPLLCSETYPSRGVQFLELQHVSYFTYLWENASIPELVTTYDCKDLCLKNCSCKAAFFRYDVNISHGYCYLESMVYSVKLNTDPDDRFYNSTAYIKFKPSSKDFNYSVVVISVSVTSGALLAVLLLWVWLRKNRKCRLGEEDAQEYSVYLASGGGLPRRFSFKDLEKATEHFKIKLGRGGFGSVFEGVLPNGTKIAVKRLDNGGQGTKEFRAEVATLGNIHHFNLVRLKGFCAEKSHRMLVYEHLPNGSLDQWIFPNQNRDFALDWKARYKIALHIARGLTYLHEECEERIIHFDVKPQNILLDQNFNAKVSDFGLSKLINREQSEVVTRIRGTPGYMAPELLNGHVTEKADIYSFGVMLVEIVSGKRNKEFATLEDNLFSFLQQFAQQERLVELIDPQVREEGMDVQEKALGMIEVGIVCIQDDFGRRPRMSNVVKALEDLTDEDDVDFPSTMVV